MNKAYKSDTYGKELEAEARILQLIFSYGFLSLHSWIYENSVLSLSLWNSLFIDSLQSTFFEPYYLESYFFKSRAPENLIIQSFRFAPEDRFIWISDSFYYANSLRLSLWNSNGKPIYTIFLFFFRYIKGLRIPYRITNVSKHVFSWTWKES